METEVGGQFKENTLPAKKNFLEGGFENLIRISDKFATINKLIMRDLNNVTSTPAFSRYTKEDIAKYLENPYRYEKQLREAVIYIYGASSHFRRLIQYFTILSDLSYIVSPYRIDPKTVNDKTVSRNYRKVLNTLSALNIKTQFSKILTVCLREDIFYGTMWVTNDSIIIQRLPSEFCGISTIENNVLNVEFNFSYFDRHKEMLENYPPEFKTKYDQVYMKDRTKNKWIELDSPTSFAVKANSDILEYSIPPFVGLLRELYDLDDYKSLKLSKTELDNYAVLAMLLPMDKDGNWQLDLPKAKEFWHNLDSILPDEIGSILTPMELKKISFESQNVGNSNTVADAEQNIFTAAGVNSLIFNNDKASSSALLLSIKADQSMTFGIVKSIEDVLNRFLQAQSYGKNFKVTFLDVSPFNRKEVGDAYLKAASYGLPTISLYAASQGLGQAELDSMSFLESSVLGLQDMFRPLINSSQMSNKESKGATDEGGAPKKEIGDISDKREKNIENE